MDVMNASIPAHGTAIPLLAKQKNFTPLLLCCK